MIQINRIRFAMTTSNRLSLAFLTVVGCGLETVICLSAIIYPRLVAMVGLLKAESTGSLQLTQFSQLIASETTNHVVASTSRKHSALWASPASMKNRLSAYGARISTISVEMHFFIWARCPLCRSVHIIGVLPTRPSYRPRHWNANVSITTRRLLS